LRIDVIKKISNKISKQDFLDYIKIPVKIISIRCKTKVDSIVSRD